MARIAHLDADAFFVSVELARRPELAGRPVAVAGQGPRSVIATASYEARRFGLRSGMPAQAARARCPQAVFLPPDFDAYREASGRLWEIVTGHLGQLERLGLDESYADLTGLERPVTSLRAALADVTGQLGLTVSAGVGPNRLVAKVASDVRKPAGLTVLSREQAVEMFAQSPPSLIPGIGPKTAQALEALGIGTLEQLRDAGAELLAGRFSPRMTESLQQMAAFHGEERLRPPQPRKSRSAEDTFPEDLESLDEMEGHLHQLAGKVAAGLAAREAAGPTVGIKVRHADFSSYTRDRTLAHPTCDSAEIAAAACELLRENPPAMPVRLLGVRVSGLDRPESELAAQLALF